MKTLAFAGLALLVAAALSAESSGDERRGAQTSRPVAAERRQADPNAERLSLALGLRPVGADVAAVVTCPRGDRSQVVRVDRGPDCRIRIISPNPGVDYKIVQIRPDLNVDYKIRNLCPGGRR